MDGLMPRGWRTLLICGALAGCSTFSAQAPETPVYEVRSATVVAGVPTISPQLISGVAQRVNAAIAATTRATPMAQVSLSIRIVSVDKAQGAQQDRNVARVDIDATAIDSGSVTGIASFETTTIAPDPTSLDELMAEDIAARVRSTFALKTPPLGS